MVLHLRQEAVHNAQLRVLRHGLPTPVSHTVAYNARTAIKNRLHTYDVDISGVHPLSPVTEVGEQL
jgi:hypothetical protein